ncbi:recombinase RecT [Pseudonocardia sp. 73-21]|uniref:recombinase RecT n=1 Tax=Pseudonocardia sp. 73-21 TaxID=1895809 RepID=UPI00096103C3|nr:recombinase RecT [Pseudonocardia sp. 73-21]OJY47632.1 MAG: recombinase RecT [Pseudonocardia sp. 73-21]
MSTVTDAASKAVATRDTGPRAMVAQYAPDFGAVLPSHVKPEQWVRVAQGALKRGKKYDGDRSGRTELEVAAGNNPAVFLASLLDAARLGLEPGTEQYYLTPRKVKGKLEILGIVGYQGHIELMYRAGAVASVVAEVVYTGDRFDYQPGVDERPRHFIDWDSDNRGDLRLVYAYAVMKDGATSKVVVLNRSAIARIKKSATGADSPYSPWTTNPDAMWLKSAVRQLAKWVPTSAEYRRQQMRDARDVAGEQPFAAPQLPADERPIDVSDLPEVGEDVLDGELVETEDEARAREQLEMEAELAAAEGDTAGES